MRKMLMEKGILGKVKANVYVVEFQKRGLPHAHFLLIMELKYKLTCPKQYDMIISAELPNKKKYPELYKMVMKHMMHGPCETLNPYCPCTGHGRALVVMRENNKADEKGNIDEIKQYRDVRKNSVFQVGRVISAHPAEGEHYFLHVLLNNVAGATSYEHLRTVDGMLLPSFYEAVERRGLIEEDNTLDECLTKATLFQMPSSLRRLFATILVFCEPHDVMGLWKKHYDAMSEDYNHNHPSLDLVQQMVLIYIRNMLQSMEKDIRSFPLLDIDHSYDDASHIPREIFEEPSIEQNPEDVLLCNSLNVEQRSTYDEIMAAVCSKQGGLFFMDGPGGMGKTFLYRELLTKLRSQDKLAVATATSRVATAIMPGRRMAHSRFKRTVAVAS
ncbi:uncharacterized protein [Miscanthus floridulus]|uniref:uncharacterized protein n=1 Tax=Miscanthus floridulus TaxID=154761 RepID=UPI00345A3D51